MSIFDRFRGNGNALTEANERISELANDLDISTENISLFKERLAELELHLEDAGWQLLSGFDKNEFSRAGLRTINYLARLYFLKNPLIRRAVLTQTQYVFGQGVNIQAKHPIVDEVIQAFLSDQKNKAELTEHQALMVKETELQCFANIFFVFFVNKYSGHLHIRTIPMDEIEDIICNPEDAKDPWYYKRVWTVSGIDPATGQYISNTFSAYYPDWRYKPKFMTQKIGGLPIMVDTPIYHVAVNKLSDMRFGVSEIYSALDWAKAYKECLEDWATITRAYSRFAWQLTTKGGAAGVAAAKARLGSTLGTSNSETNPPPVTASTFISTEGVKIDPIKTAGATTKAEDGRFLRLMVSSATGIFEHYLTGDPSTGNLATAKAMELPMLIMFRDRQQLWTSILKEILNFVVDWAVRAGVIPGTIEKDVYGEETVTLANDKDNEDLLLRDKPIDRSIDIDFPSILEDIETRVNAVVAAATLDGKAPAGTLDIKLVSRLLLEALGLDDVDKIMAEMYPPEEEGAEKPPDNEEMFVSVVRNLDKAITEVFK